MSEKPIRTILASFLRKMVGLPYKPCWHGQEPKRPSWHAVKQARKERDRKQRRVDETRNCL